MNQCDDITVNFRQPSNRVTISDNIIGIENREEVEIRCECSGPRGASPVWTKDDNDISTDNKDEVTPYIAADGPRHSLRISRFEEDATGQYICDSRDTTVVFNLVWYDPSKSCITYDIQHEYINRYRLSHTIYINYYTFAYCRSCTRVCNST